MSRGGSSGHEAILAYARARSQLPESRMELDGAMLDGLDLRGISLPNASLRRASMRGALLARAELRGADLFEADLSGADLSHSDLRHASLRYAVLRDAIFDGASMENADLAYSDLTGARVTVAELVGVRLDGATLPSELRQDASAIGSLPAPPPSTAGAAGITVGDEVLGYAAAERPPAPGHEVVVWFGTNRKPIVSMPMQMQFSNERGDAVHYGRCTVFIPKAHRVGSLGSAWIRRLLVGDDRVALRAIETMSEDSYWNTISGALSSLPESERTAIVYIHGYNTPFVAAARRAAQIGVDLGAAALTAFFSWPSQGRAKAYPADEAAIEASSGAIGDFLLSFAKQSGATRVHVIAHSMGNRGLARALADVAARTSRQGICLGQIILAAPDVDVAVFKQLASAFGKLAEQTTLYVSERDFPVKLSADWHQYPRVGRIPPVTVVGGVDTVSVGPVDLTLLGHAYHGTVRSVLIDMFQAIRNGLPPDRRAHLERMICQDGTYWAFRA